MPGCLDENTVIEFIQGLLSPEAVQRIEEHIDACRDCRLLLGEVAKMSFPGSSRRSSQALPATSTFATGPTRLRADPCPRDESAGAPRSGLGPTRSRADPAGSLPPLESDRSGDAAQEGQVLAGRFRIVRRLGRGSFGAVYEAEDLQLQERVALKLLRPEVRAVPSLLKHLHHEIVVGRRISHPNVCRIFDLGTYGDTHFISMELLRGEILDQRLARGVPPTKAAVGILRQIAAALEAAHAQGVVHRDLKPGNIMIDEQGKITVMDFGLARDLRAMPSMSGALIGSPAYWSPEQAHGERATERSDLYTLGLIACDLLGAVRPGFGDESRHLGAIAQPYRAIVERCLRPRPEDRFASAQALGVALRRAERRTGRRRPLVLGALLGAACVGGGVVYVMTRPAAPPGTDVVAGAPLTLDARARWTETSAGPTATPSTATATVVDARPALATAPRPDAESDGPESRRSRPGRRRTTIAAPVVEEPVPPVAARDARALPPAPVRLAAAHRARLVSLEAERRRRGLLLDDAPELRAHTEEARRACDGSDDQRAALALGRLEQTLRRVQIDGTFISRKLERLNKLKESLRPVEATAKQVTAIFARVHDRYFSGDYVAANAHLNSILRLLGRGE